MELDIEQILNQAQAFSQEGKEQQSRDLLQDFLAVETENIPALLMLGGSLI